MRWSSECKKEAGQNFTVEQKWNFLDRTIIRYLKVALAQSVELKIFSISRDWK